MYHVKYLFFRLLFQVCFFVNSGSEANDMALMMARAHTGNFDIVSLRYGHITAKINLAD